MVVEVEISDNGSGTIILKIFVEGNKEKQISTCSILQPIMSDHFIYFCG